MNPRFYEISEAQHTLQYPMSLDSVLELGRKLDIRKSTRVLDLASGKGELLCQWAREFDAIGVGVDGDEAFVTQAHERANTLDVGLKINFVHDDPISYPQSFHEYDVIISMRLAQLGTDLPSVLELMKPALRSHDSKFIIGEPFWKEEPDEAILDDVGLESDTLMTLGQILYTFDEAQLELIDFVQSSTDDWDRYEGLHWRAVYDWILDNPNELDVGDLREWNANNRRLYMMFGRRYIGWGMFVLGKR